ncbi:hypothetical protein SAMN05444722_1708 [Rhodovulum sp. ES.010]|uniref:hypothetical protein n=1 Tax=Rhodovulum sp. ES.010 TaxID=1882821 RepID=UPI00092CB14A|nr:hypothetical protein [Rhodovulum sp. ES.010]SIO36835.1 hypothetical protein SAMN05444722_1708 [Rhodovulum sp. ES.010]
MRQAYRALRAMVTVSIVGCLGVSAAAYCAAARLAALQKFLTRKLDTPHDP